MQRASELRALQQLHGQLAEALQQGDWARLGEIDSLIRTCLKLLAGLDIAERRRPQDGRLRLTVDDREHDARVSTLPGIDGEKLVLRLLASATDVPAVDALGLDAVQQDALLGALQAPSGLVLVTGPTGSGKTTTLYAGLKHVATAERNVVTLEDPVEVRLPGATQVQVNERAGLTFGTGLRAVLRQDPDVVLVGEIRDRETADLALKAAMTGHLVLATLHTRSAVGALGRLVEMGCDPAVVAASVTLVVAQRLLRAPCGGCARRTPPSVRTLHLLGLRPEDVHASRSVLGTGCRACSGTGYAGRTGVFEVLGMTSTLRGHLAASGPGDELAAEARRTGHRELRDAALDLAAAGVTSYEEVLRTTQATADGEQRCGSCTRGVSSSMIVCPWCAADLHPATCGGCDKVLDERWGVCPWCRASTTADADADPVTVPAQRDAEPGRVRVEGSVRPDASAPTRPVVLVVDDDEVVLAVASAVLEPVAVPVTASTAADALDAVRRGGVDAVVLDHALPDGQGLDLLRRLREDAATADLPVVVVSGSDEETLVLQAERAGADGFLRKPVTPDGLVTAVRMLLGVGEAALH